MGPLGGYLKVARSRGWCTSWDWCPYESQRPCSSVSPPCQVPVGLPNLTKASPKLDRLAPGLQTCSPRSVRNKMSVVYEPPSLWAPKTQSVVCPLRHQRVSAPQTGRIQPEGLVWLKPHKIFKIKVLNSSNPSCLGTCSLTKDPKL